MKTADEIKKHLEKPEVHKALVGDYGGQYAVGIEEDEQGAHYRLGVADMADYKRVKGVQTGDDAFWTLLSVMADGEVHQIRVLTEAMKPVTILPLEIPVK